MTWLRNFFIIFSDFPPFPPPSVCSVREKWCDNIFFVVKLQICKKLLPRIMKLLQDVF